MENTNKRRKAKIFFLEWAILFFLYSLFVTWLSIGPTALSGPSTLNEDIMSGLWFSLSVLQLIMAILARKRDNPWLFWITATLVVLTIAMLAVPWIMLLIFE